MDGRFSRTARSHIRLSIDPATTTRPATGKTGASLLSNRPVSPAGSAILSDERDQTTARANPGRLLGAGATPRTVRTVMATVTTEHPRVTASLEVQRDECGGDV